MFGGGKQKRFSRRENSELSMDKISRREKVDEITKLQELHQQVINVITSLQQENAGLLSDKTNLEASVLQLKTEKMEVECELTESKARTMDLIGKFERGRHLWDSESQKWEGIVAELQTQVDLMGSERELLRQKNRELCTGAETLNSQLNVMESELNESNERTGELLQKIENQQHLWDKDRRNMENSLEELQTNFELMARERGSLTQKNREVRNEVEILKIKVNEHNDTLACIQDERQLLKALSLSDSKRLEALLTQNATMQDKIDQLQQKVDEVVKQQSDSVQQYKVTENALTHQNKILQEQVDSTRCLLEIQNAEYKQSIVENVKLNKQVDELSKKFEELSDTYIKQVHEKEEHKMEFELLVAKKYKALLERHFELLKENAKQGKMIETLQRVNASLVNKRRLLLQRLHEADKSSEEISDKCLKSDHKVLELESESSRLHTELAAKKLACNETTIQLNKLKEDMNKLSNNSCPFQEEKESLHEKLMLQISRTKALEEELLSTKSSLEEMKESASKGGQEIANLRSQLSAIAEEEDSQFFDTQSQLLAMEVDKMSQLADLEDQFPSLAWAKGLLEEENTSFQIELDGRTLVSEKEQVNSKGRVKELETKDLVDLQYQLSDLTEPKKGLKQKNNYLLSELRSKLKQPSQVKSPVIQNGKQKNCLVKSKLKQPLPVKSPVNQNGKPKSVDEKPKPNGVHENRKPRCVHEKPKPNGVHENGKPHRVIERTPKLMIENPKPKGVHEMSQQRRVHKNGKQNGVLEMRTPINWMAHKQKLNRITEKRTSKWVP